MKCPTELSTCTCALTTRRRRRRVDKEEEEERKIYEGLPTSISPLLPLPLLFLCSFPPQSTGAKFTSCLMIYLDVFESNLEENLTGRFLTFEKTIAETHTSQPSPPPPAATRHPPPSPLSPFFIPSHALCIGRGRGKKPWVACSPSARGCTGIL